MAAVTESNDPRKFARARAGLRRYRDLLEGLDLLVEAEEQLEPLRRQVTEARAELDDVRRQSGEVKNEAAARKAKLEAADDRDLAEKRGEIARLAAVIASQNDEARRATERADAAQADCKRWVEARAKLEPTAA